MIVQMSLSPVIVGVGMKVLFLLYARDHLPEQEVVVLHHGPSGFVGDGGPAVPDPLPALHPEDVPESSRLHLLWSPAVEIVPGDAVKDLQVLGAQANFVMLPTVWDLVNKLYTGLFLDMPLPQLTATFFSVNF